MGPLKVLFVMGFTRTGGTLLARLLNEAEGVFAAGGMRHLWQVGVLEDRRCSCGERFGSCEVWPRIMEAAFGRREHRPDARVVLEWQDAVLRTRNIPRLLRLDRVAPSGWKELDAFRRLQSRLYEGIREATGARVAVDTSRWAAHAAALPLIEGVEPYVLHLVRDPRAVAHSWRRRKANPDLGEREEFEQFEPWRIAVGYSAYNASAEVIRRRYGPRRSMFLRYEDLVADPPGTLRAVARLLAESGVGESLVGRQAFLGVNHMVTGNPNRFEHGPVTLELDDEWRTRQPYRDRALVTAGTLPLLLRYGYPVRVRPRA